MIETRMIDDALFVVSHTGRTERLLVPSEAVAEARAGISALEVKLREIASDADNLRAQIEEAVLFDEPSVELRTRLTSVMRESETLRAAIGGHRTAIADIAQAVDRHHAATLQRQHAASLAALTEPFDQILREFAL